MEKQEFIKRIGETLALVKELNYRSCSAIQIVFYEDIKRQTRKRYVESIKHLIMKNSPCIDWDRLGINYCEAEKKKEARINLLKNFEAECLRDKFYERL